MWGIHCAIYKSGVVMRTFTPRAVGSQWDEFAEFCTNNEHGMLVVRLVNAFNKSTQEQNEIIDYNNDHNKNWLIDTFYQHVNQLRTIDFKVVQCCFKADGLYLATLFRISKIDILSYPIEQLSELVRLLEAAVQSSIVQNDKPFIAAPPSDQYWRYNLPDLCGKKMQLRTVGGVCVIGQWYGQLGEYFVAWAPLLSN